jgi:hypothetical protein
MPEIRDPYDANVYNMKPNEAELQKAAQLLEEPPVEGEPTEPMMALPPVEDEAVDSHMAKTQKMKPIHVGEKPREFQGAVYNVKPDMRPIPDTRNFFQKMRDSIRTRFQR